MNVKLYIRVRLANGKRAYLNPVYAGNGRLKPFYAYVNGQPEHHPEGVYTLRYCREGKPVWEGVGTDPQQAVTARLKRERFQAARAVGINIKDDASGERSISEAIAEYLDEVKAGKSLRTYHAYSETLRHFHRTCDKLTLETIDRHDILKFIKKLQERGNSRRTVHNRVGFLKIFFNRFGLPWPMLKTDRVKFTEKIVSAYSSRDIQALMAAADQDEADLFQFLLCTGVREQEAMYATWRDVDLHRKTFQVREKLDRGFTPKDKEEGEIPIPDSLIDVLRERRKRYPNSTLVFPHPNGLPNGHLLRILKDVAYRAGLNCGECVNKAGKGCATSPTCSRFGLHRFRKTFATMHHESGVSARTIQRWLRHSNLETTLRYLAGADDMSEKTRSQVNKTFIGLLPATA